MKKLLVSFLVASLLISLVVALDHIVVTDPVTDQKLGSIVDVKWDTTQIPKGLKPTDKVSVRIKCGRRSVPPKAVPHEPFMDGHKKIELFDDPSLIGASCFALIFDEDHDVTGSSKFKIIK